MSTWERILHGAANVSCLETFFRSLGDDEVREFARFFADQTTVEMKRNSFAELLRGLCETEAAERFIRKETGK